ncbi:MAG: hypothetical protein IV090_19615 [Candidatus Sericytochromatia bacterium]|nr:hypothetical protein [Candidatus Sericytochromatia bacterium]
MDSLNGQSLGTWKGRLFDSTIKAKEEVGKGFESRDEAVAAAQANQGAEAIVKDKEGQYHVYAIDDGSAYAFTKANIEQVKDYPVSKIVNNPKQMNFEMVSMVTEDNYEFVAPSVHQNRLSGDRFVIDKTRHPQWDKVNWPVGSDVTPAQEERAIKLYTSMSIQQFRSQNGGRDPNPRELLATLIDNAKHLPYASTAELAGKFKIAGSPLKIFGSENSSSVVFQTGTGRCGDLADLHYKFAMEGAKQLGFEQKMKDSLFIIGVQGVGGANVNHAALGFVDPPDTVANLTASTLSTASVYDPWLQQSQSRDATTWGTEYCFDILEHPLLPLRNVIGTFQHGFQTKVDDPRYKMMAFTPDYSTRHEFDYSLRK